MNKMDCKHLAEFVFKDMVDVLKRVEDCGFPPSNIPPHACGVSLVQESDEEYAIARTSPESLTETPQEFWISSTMSKAHFHFLEKTKEELLGVFIGFISETSTRQRVYVGLLAEAVGKKSQVVLAPISNLDKAHFLSHEDAESLFPKMLLNFEMFCAGDIGMVH